METSLQKIIPLFENYSGIVILKNSLLEVEFVNQKFLDHWSLKNNDLLGKTIYNAMCMELVENEQINENLIFKSNSSEKYSVLWITNNQPTYWNIKKYIISIDECSYLIILGDQDDEKQKAIEAEKRSEVYLKAIVDYSDPIMVVLNANCQIQNFLGSEKLVNSPDANFKTLIQEIISVEESDEIRNKISTVIITGQRLVTTNSRLFLGKTYFFKDTYYPIKSIGEEIREIGLVREDISSDKEIKDAYQAIVNNSIFGLMIVQDDYVVFTNRVASQITGYSNEQIKLHSFLELIEHSLPKDEKLFVEKAYKKMKLGEIKKDVLQFRIIQTDKSKIWVEVYSNHILYNGSDAIQFLIFDITNKIESENRLQRNKHILNSSNEQILYVDNELSIQMVNEQTSIAFAKNYTELYGLRILDLLNYELNGKPLEDAISRCIQKGLLWRGERWIIYPNEGRFMEISLYPYYESNNKQVSGVVVVMRDLTDTLNTELQMLDIIEKERRNIAMQLHDGLTHELLGLSIWTNLLGKKIKKKTPILYQSAKAIEEGLNGAIKTARDLSRGISPLKEENITIYQLIDELVDLLEKRYSITCHVDMEKGLELSDERVLENIYYIIDETITNSVKHSGTTDVFLNIYNKNHFTVINLRDEGCGFDLEKRVFGMGLKYIKRRARSISGTVDVTSAPGKGTLVVLKIGKV